MSDRTRLKREDKKRELIISGLLALGLALLLIWPVVLHPTQWLWKPGSPASDLAVTHWPNAHFTRRMLWEEGRFPLWRPTIMSGTPFAANPLAGLYYPPNWLFLFLPAAFAGSNSIPAGPLALGFNLSALTHLALAGVAMVVLMRRGFDTGFWGGLAAAVAYQASPKLLAHLGAGHVGWVQAWAWLPLVILCALRACQSEGRRASRWALGMGLALAVQFCADVRLSAYTLMAAASLVLARIVSRSGERRSPTTGMKSAIAALARGSMRPLHLSLKAAAVFAGLSACQWLPGLALLPKTTRSAMTLADAAVWSLPWRYLSGLLLADHGGFQEWMTYVGVSTLVLAWVGARALWRTPDRRWLGAWLIGLGAFATWFSLGKNGGLFQVLWRMVPVLGLLRVPPRAWVLVTFAMAVLAGLGLEEIGQRQGNSPPTQRRWRRALLLGVAALPPMFTAAYWLAIGRPPLNLAVFGLMTPLTMAVASKPLGVSSGPTHDPRWPAVVGVLLVTLDLLVVDVTLIEARPAEDIFDEGRAAAEWLAGQPGRFRVYSPSYSIPQHVAERYTLELADGVDPLQLQPYATYLTAAAGLRGQRGYSVTLPPFPEGSDCWTALADMVPDTEMLGQLGVRYVTAAFPIAHRRLTFVRRLDDVYVYQNKDARPPAGEPSAPRILLADGKELFRYRPWAVYMGWALSCLTLIGVVICVARDE